MTEKLKRLAIIGCLLAISAILGIPLFFIKLFEIVRATIRIPEEGESYRNRFLNLLDETKWSRKLKTSKIEEIEKDFKFDWPFIRTRIQNYADEKEKNPQSIKILFYDILAKIVYRQPSLVILLSIALFILSRAIANKIIILIMAFSLFLSIFWELAYLFLRRIYLGFTDNFRGDFELNIGERFTSLIYHWSISEFVFKIVRALSAFIASSIAGFYAIFVGLQQFDNQSFSFKICTNTVPDWVQLAYFTVVTFATVGYGDITPGTFWAQFFVVWEILFGIGTLVFLFFALSTTLNPDRDVSESKAPKENNQEKVK